MTYFNLTKAIFEYVSQEKLDVITASLTLTEVLMKPIQAKNRRLQREYRDLLLNTKNVSTIAIDTIIATKAAELRAKYNLKTPDALHVASAIVSGCDAFLTNDDGIKRVTEITILILDDLEI
ncbi:MAG: PIN domain-containing protein [Anaerolineae bacterium]|nr:PIN domain-containing protein [Anaerolineae bacterium]MDQ7033519.1 PIN domain-containing protein [Anaerolineae bacterium]